MKVFNYDSPIWRFMGRIADFFCLTILFVVTSLPIFTIGTSLTTIYYITLKMADNKEEYIIPMYFKTFTKVFKEATPNSILVVIVGIFLCGDVWICYVLRNPMTTIFLAAFGVIGMLYVIMVMYFFPIMARTNNTVLGYAKASFYLAIRYFSWTILLLVIPTCVFAVGVFLFWPLLLFSVGLTAYLQSLIFHQIFKQQGWDLDHAENELTE